MIQGHGPAHPKVFLIADGAFGDDLKTNYAISGYAQSLLAGFCKEQGLHMGDFYKTCLVKEELTVSPRDKSSKKTDTYLAGNAAQVEKYAPLLLEEINELQPFLLVPLGELGFNYLTELRGIRKFRGSILPPSGAFNFNQTNTKVLPILGPEPYLYSDYKLRFLTRVDFSKLPQYLNDRPIPDNFYKIWVARNASALRTFLDRSYEGWQNKFLCFDIETFFGIPTCISFCFDGFESVCVPLVDSAISVDNRLLMLDLVYRVLKSDIRKVNQNVKFDWRILERWGFIVKNVIGDTMLAASTLYAEFPKNLGFLTSIYTDLPYFKDEGKEWDPLKYKKDRFYLYNAKDSLSTHQIYGKQIGELQEQGTQWVYDRLIELLPVYRRMEDRGLLVDQAKRQQLLSKYYNLYLIECKKLADLIERQYVNPLSHVQMNKIVYDELGYLPVRGVKKGKDGKPGTDEDSLALLKVFGEPKRSPNFGPIILDVIIACRKLHKVLEILELPLWPDGRFRCEYNLAGTETGRSSGGESTDQLLFLDGNKVGVTNLGHSLQTIGKHGFVLNGETYGQDIRKIYVASPGFTFVEVDLSGAEARVDAILAGITDLAYFENPGIHKLTASWCFDCDPRDIIKNQLVPFGSQDIDRYHVGKQVRHAGERNIQAAGLVTKLLWGFTVKQGETLLKKFHKFQPEMKGTFHRDVNACVNATHCLIAPNGRRRDFFDRVDQNLYNQAYSQLPQAIVSDQTKFHGILDTCKEVDWAFPVEEAHDGTLWEVPIGREHEFIEIYKRNIEKPIDFKNCSLSRDVQLVIPCETAVGPNWYDMEEVK